MKLPAQVHRDLWQTFSFPAENCLMQHSSHTSTARRSWRDYLAGEGSLWEACVKGPISLSQNQRTVGFGWDLWTWEFKRLLKQVPYSKSHLARCVLTISREGDSSTSLGSLFHNSLKPTVKKFFTDAHLWQREQMVMGRWKMPYIQTHRLLS